MRAARRIAKRLMRADPFVEDTGKSNTGSAKDYVHIRIQQRNGRKSLTTVQVHLAASWLQTLLHDLRFCRCYLAAGRFLIAIATVDSWQSRRLRYQHVCNNLQGIKASYDYKKILKALKKEYCCNGTVVEDDELGQVIQVQGDQRKNIADFLTTVRTCCDMLCKLANALITAHSL